MVTVRVFFNNGGRVRYDSLRKQFPASNFCWVTKIPNYYRYPLAGGHVATRSPISPSLLVLDTFGTNILPYPTGARKTSYSLVPFIGVQYWWRVSRVSDNTSEGPISISNDWETLMFAILTECCTFGRNGHCVDNVVVYV